MSTFPVLNTGAVAQYPLTISTGPMTQVVRFLDGTDQRFQLRNKSLRQWEIKLELLNASEIQQIEQFFTGTLGNYASFSFPDPFSGNLVPNCRFGASGLLTESSGPDLNSTSFWIIETNG